MVAEQARGWRDSVSKAEACFGLFWNIFHLSILDPLLPRQEVFRSRCRETPRGRSFCQVLPLRCVWTGPRVSLCLWSVKGFDLVTCVMRTQFFLQGFSKKGFAFPARVPRLQTNTYRNQPHEARVRKFQSPVQSPREVTPASGRLRQENCF